MALLFWAVIYFIFFSPLFLIKSIAIKGNENIPMEDIKNITKEEISKPIFGFIPGNNFFFNRERKIESALLKKFSEIKDIEIKKEFPNDIKIEIVQKDPAIIWCRLNSCYYLDSKGVSFLVAENNIKMEDSKRLIKIIEQREIEEETKEKIETEIKDRELIKDEEVKKEKGKTEETEKSEEVIAEIKLNEKVADEDFINFVLEIDKEIKNSALLKIKYYKTKGVKKQELIAYTDKNVRLYFDTTSDAVRQAKDLNDFLLKGIEKEKIDALRYIYLKAEGKVYYK